MYLAHLVYTLLLNMSLSLIIFKKHRIFNGCNGGKQNKRKQKLLLTREFSKSNNTAEKKSTGNKVSGQLTEMEICNG